MSERDIVERLRAISSALSASGFAGCDARAEALCHEAASEISRLREERKPVVVMPMPFEPWRHGPLSYAKCEIIAALKKAGVKWQPQPPGPEPKQPNRE